MADDIAAHSESNAIFPNNAAFALPSPTYASIPVAIPEAMAKSNHRARSLWDKSDNVTGAYVGRPGAANLLWVSIDATCNRTSRIYLDAT